MRVRFITLILLLSVFSTLFMSSVNAAWVQLPEQLRANSSSMPYFDRINRVFVLNATIRNLTDKVIQGPIRLYIESKNHTVTNADGIEDGIYYITLLDSQLRHGELTIVPITLELKRATYDISLSAKIEIK